MKKTAVLFAMLFVIAVICVFPSFAAESEESFILSVNPYGGNQNDIDTIEWLLMDDGSYYLFLPSDINSSKLHVFFTQGRVTVKLNDTIIENGQTVEALSKSGKHTVSVNGTEYLLNVYVSEKLPAVFIETESGSLDYVHENKENKEAADIRIYEDGKNTLDSELKHIKGRGNTTWTDYDKKPYNIKFDEKTKVLGMKKAKKWSLLASSSDTSIIRNPLAWKLSEILGIDYTSDYRIIDLYINGEYLGNYIICESVEIGKNRVDIFDLAGATEELNDLELEEYSRGGTGEGGSVPYWNTFPSATWSNIPNNPEDITGGYLLEFDFSNRYLDSMSGFVTSRNQSVAIKEPEYSSEAQVRYISSYYQEAEDALASKTGFNSLGKHYSEYFDMDSLVNMYLISEFSSNYDAGKTSTYFYKDQGGKLVAAPVWDFDRAFCSNTDNWVVNLSYYNENEYNTAKGELPTVFTLLFSHEDFREAVKERWSEVKELIAGEDIIKFIKKTADKIETSAVMNAVRWGYFETADEFKNRVNVAINFISARRKALDKGFGENAAYIVYNLNGGTGVYLDNHIYEDGDTVTVLSPYKNGENGRIAFPPSIGLMFSSWNTEVDGSGITYIPGDKMVLDGYTTLYAQWADPAGINQKYESVFDAIIAKVLPIYNAITDRILRLDNKYSLLVRIKKLLGI